jgi:hypothetical protein
MQALCHLARALAENKRQRTRIDRERRVRKDETRSRGATSESNLPLGTGVGWINEPSLEAALLSHFKFTAFGEVLWLESSFGASPGLGSTRVGQKLVEKVVEFIRLVHVRQFLIELPLAPH